MNSQDKFDNTIKQTDPELTVDKYTEGLNRSTIYFNNMKQANSYKFDKFDPIKELNDKRNFSMIISSKRRTGKSVFVKDICHQIKGWYNSAYLFSMTSDLQPDLYDFIPESNVYNSFNEDKLEEIWSIQEKLITALRAAKAPDSDMPHILIILDDVISDTRVKKSEILNRLFVAGRHLKFAVIAISQTFTGFGPTLRVNCDVSVAFYLDSQDNREAFAKQYLSTKNKNLGIMIFERITKEPYQCIVCLNCKTSSNPEDTIKTYTAKLKVPKFKISAQGLKNITYLADIFRNEANNDKVHITVSKNKETIKLK